MINTSVSIIGEDWTDVEDVRKQIILINPLSWVNPTFFLEVIGSLNVGDWARLYNITTGTPVAASEFEGSASYGRQRSSGFSLPDGDNEYKFQLKGASILKQIRVIVIDDFGVDPENVTKAEQQIDTGDITSTASTTYVESTTPYYLLWETTPFDGNLTYFFEATFYRSLGTGYVELYNLTDMVQVCELSTTSDTPTRVRSGPITLKHGKIYVFRMKIGSAAPQVYVTGTKIIVRQTGNPINKMRVFIRHGYPHEKRKTYCQCSYADVSLDGYFRIKLAELFTLKAVYWEGTIKHELPDVPVGIEVCRDTTCTGYTFVGGYGNYWHRDRGGGSAPEYVGTLQDDHDYTGSIISWDDYFKGYISYYFLLLDVEVVPPTRVQYCDAWVTIRTE